LWLVWLRRVDSGIGVQDRRVSDERERLGARDFLLEPWVQRDFESGSQSLRLDSAQFQVSDYSLVPETGMEPCWVGAYQNCSVVSFSGSSTWSMGLGLPICVYSKSAILFRNVRISAQLIQIQIEPTPKTESWNNLQIESLLPVDLLITSRTEPEVILIILKSKSE
jgi:hypothetical protein